MAIQQDLASAHRRQQAQLRTRIVSDMVTLWNSEFDPSQPGTSWPEVRRLTVSVIRDRYPVSVRLATDYYSQARQIAGLTGDFQPVSVPQPPEEQLVSALNATGIAAYRTALGGGQSPNQAKNTAGVTLSGAASRLVAEGGRQTVHRSAEQDDQALGYMRITDADPCSFCAMLASRGPTYKTAATAGDPRGGGRRYHDHCACTAAPVFGSDDEWMSQAEDLSQQWVRVTSGLSGDEARNAWRRYWESRED